MKRSKRDLRRSSTKYDLFPPVMLKCLVSEKTPPLRLKSGTAERKGCFFFGKGFLQNIQLERAPSVSMRKYVGTKLVSDLHIKKIIGASILQRLGTKLYSRIATHQQSADQAQ